MKLRALLSLAMFGALVTACGAGNNGGWVTKGGWDPASRAQAPAPARTTADPADNIPLSALDLENPYVVDARPKVTDEHPYEAAPTEKAASSKAKSTKEPLKGDEPGF